MTKKFLWLDGIFDDATVNEFRSTSPATNFWQKGFVSALQSLGNDVKIIGYPYERIWPFGRLIVKSSHSKLLPGFEGRTLGYINFPGLRGLTQYLSYKLNINKHLQGDLPDYIVTFSCLEDPEKVNASIKIARQIKSKYNIPWVCIVGDGLAPPGANAYIYNTWSYFENPESPKPSIHIDGGIPEINSAESGSLDINKKILMYMGALSEHGGATELAQSFTKIPGENIELWICGRGENDALQKISANDKRIVLKGFVPEDELNKLANSAYGFANPRPYTFAPNQLNYPSKLLHYFAYRKPVISTITNGLSPEYKSLLIPVENDTDESHIDAINDLFNMNQNEYNEYIRRISSFNDTHSWNYQVTRFIDWIEELLKRS